MRQALAGMLWSKQYYSYDVDAGSAEHGMVNRRTPGSSATVSGPTWRTTISSPCRTGGSTRGSRPGIWHFTALRSLSWTPIFAKQQLDLMLHSIYLHPNGQLPAYEWNFGDVNPPVHAWAAYFLYMHGEET